MEKGHAMPAYPFPKEEKKKAALVQKEDEKVPPPRPSQSGWNTAANAIKKPGNETKCNPLSCGAYSITSDRACCHDGDEVEKDNQMPAYPYPKPKEEKKKALAQK